eukprot:Sdes_comp20517_c0_seq3m15076
MSSKLNSWQVGFASIKTQKNISVVSPPGWSQKPLQQLDDRIGDQQQQQGNNSLKLKKAWDIALAPGKSIPMNAFMMYMAGNTVHIFSIMITGMMFLNPMKALFSVSQTFTPFEDTKTAGGVSVTLPKLAYIALNLFCIGMALYKCSKLGVLPTSSSDWLAFLPHPQVKKTL